MTRALSSTDRDDGTIVEADPVDLESTRAGSGPEPGLYTEWSSGLGAASGSGGPSRRGIVGKIEPGQTLYAKYRVLRRLGGGAMGDVWLVRHVMHKGENALKVIVPNFASSTVALMRFQREFEVMATLRHEHAVTIYDACIDADGGYIDMEYVEGRTIHEVLAMARARAEADPAAPLMPLDWIVRVLDQLCDVLQVAHAKGIVHRDLKPSNMMLVGGRDPGKEYLKVLDFGIAKVRDDPEGVAGRDQGAAEPKTQGFIGTPSYGSPEQALGVADLDGRADLYAVGVILYEFIAGRLPFRGNHWQVMSQQAYNDPPPFAEANPRLRPMPELERAIFRMLAKDRAQRPQTARQLIEEFRRAVDATPEGDSAPKPLSRKVPPVASLPPTHLDGSGLEPPSSRDDTLLAAASSPAVGVAPPRWKLAAVLRSRRWMISITLTACSALLIVPMIRATPKPGAPDPLLEPRPPLLGKAVVPPRPQEIAAPPKPADFERHWPSTYRPVEGYSQGMPWPEKVRRSTDEAVFVRVAEGVYIPETFEPDPKAGLAVDGWPKAIVKEGIRFSRIPGGTWVMGAWDNPNALDRADAPAHPVRLTGYYLQETEATHGQVEDYLREVDASFPTDWEKAFNRLKQQVGPDVARRYPASNVSRDLAQRFGGWIGGQLPTEAQWEYAARSMGQNRRYVWGNAPAPDRDLARIDAIDATPAPVGTYPRDATEQGVLDMLGNLQEMCRDAWISSYTKSDDAVLDPCILEGDPARPRYTIRGGNYGSIVNDCATTRRDDSLLEADLADHVGFRLVVECPDSRKPR